MSWKDEYINLLIERLEFKGFSRKPDAPSDPTLLIKNYQQRLTVLLEAGLSGDETAKILYLTICEDYLRSFMDQYKSSIKYLDEHRQILNNLNRLKAKP